MTRSTLLFTALIGTLVACQMESLNTGCPPGALCALRPTLMVTGQVRASLNPLAGVKVTVTAYQGSCDGRMVTLLPSPAEAVTDAEGRYSRGVEPTEALVGACLRVAYSSALKMDTPGVTLRIPPAVPETLRVDIVGP